MPPATQLPTRPAGPGGAGRPPRHDRTKLLGTRRGAIAVAVAAGLAALAVLLLFMANYRNSVKSGEETIHVLVAARQLDRGTPGDAIAEAGLFKTTEVRREEADEGALTSVKALRGKHTTTSIDRNEQLTAADFAPGSDAVTGHLAGIERALSVPVSTAHGNIGQVRDGSRVDVLGGYSAEVSSAGRAQPALSILAHDVLVLSAPHKSSGGIGSSSKEQPVVLRLTDAEAARVGYAAEHGNVWLAIRPPTLAKEANAGSGGAEG
jgi:Flp pilus assembly protein CpaB